jgi:hypothetical protein
MSEETDGGKRCGVQLKIGGSNWLVIDEDDFQLLIPV